VNTEGVRSFFLKVLSRRLVNLRVALDKSLLLLSWSPKKAVTVYRISASLRAPVEQLDRVRLELASLITKGRG
jgi:hypothetical protein